MTDVTLEYKKIDPARKDSIAVLAINRPHAANSFNKEVIVAFEKHLNDVANNQDCRALVLKGQGKNFSGGADLQWMKASQKLSAQENKKESQQLMNMFEQLYRLPKPTIALVQGAAFGGAVGLVSCCDLAIACDDARFCFSEIKLGLVPAVILPYLAKKIAPHALKYLALTGRVFDSKEAQDCGLVHHVCSVGESKQVLHQELNHLLSSAPMAMTSLKNLLQHLEDNSRKQDELMVDSIAQIRVGKEAQGGISAFFAKEKPQWVMKLSQDWTIHE